MAALRRSGNALGQLPAQEAAGESFCTALDLLVIGPNFHGVAARARVGNYIPLNLSR